MKKIIVFKEANKKCRRITENPNSFKNRIGLTKKKKKKQKQNSKTNYSTLANR